MSSWKVFVCCIKNMMLIRSDCHGNSPFNFEKRIADSIASTYLDTSASVFRIKLTIFWIQIYLHIPESDEPEFMINWAIFGGRNPPHRLNCAIIHRIHDKTEHFSCSKPVRCIETYLYFDPEHVLSYNKNNYFLGDLTDSSAVQEAVMTTHQNGCSEEGRSRGCLSASASFLAEISVRSPRKLLIFII